jgi:hypothetical protein
VLSSYRLAADKLVNKPPCAMLQTSPCAFLIPWITVICGSSESSTSRIYHGFLLTAFLQFSARSEMSTPSEASQSRIDAISALSAPRLRNILAYLAEEAEAESQGRLATIDTLIRLRTFSNETYPDPDFDDLAKIKLEARSTTQTPRAHSSGTQTLERASDGPTRQETSEPMRIKDEPQDENQGPRIRPPEPVLRPATDTPVTNKKRAGSPLSDEASPAKRGPTIDISGRHDIRQSRSAAVRRLGYGSWYEDYDYWVAIDSENMLVFYPKTYPDQVTGIVFPRKDAFRRVPLSRVCMIFRGGDRCAKIIIFLSHSRDGEDNAVLLELKSESDVDGFTTLIHELAVRNPDIKTENRRVILSVLNVFCWLTWLSADIESAWNRAQQRLQRDTQTRWST